MKETTLSPEGIFAGYAPKWPTLLLLSLAELLGMAVWFSASAVVPALTGDWSLTEGLQFAPVCSSWPIA